MKIKRIRIENLLSYDEFELEFPDFTVIVGPNNVGKTNILRVLEFVRNLLNKSINGDELDELLHDPEKRRAKVEIYLELSDDEINYIRKIISWCLAREVERAKEGEVSFELNIDYAESRIKKLLGSGQEDSKETEGKTLEIRKELEYLINQTLKDTVIKARLNSLFLRELEEFQRAVPEEFRNLKVVWTYEGQATWLPKPVFEVNDFYIYNTGVIYSSNKTSMPSSKIDCLVAMKRTFVEYLIIYKWDKNTNLTETFQKALQEAETNSWKWDEFTLKHFTYICSSKVGVPISLKVNYNSLLDKYKFEAKELYNKFGWEVGEGRDLWDLLGGIFISSVIKLGEIRGLPSEKEYKQIKEYDGKGEDLTSFLHSLKELSDPRLEEIKTQFKHFFPLDIDTIRDPSVEKAPKLVIKKGGRRFPINAIGSGVFEILNLISTIAGSIGKVIILDEPALHLHPLYQKKVLYALKDLKNQNQIILITHSPYLVDSEVLENTYRFYMDRHTTRAVKVSDVFNRSDTKTITKILRDSSFIRALFASGVIIVEGDSEYLSVPILLKKYGYPLEDYNIEIINARSDTNIKSCIEIVEELHILFRVVGDKKAEDKIPSQYLNKSFLCPAGDWKDYLESKFDKGGGGKIDAVWNIVNRITKDDIEEKMSDFKEFIEEKFINKLMDNDNDLT